MLLSASSSVASGATFSYLEKAYLSVTFDSKGEVLLLSASSSVTCGDTFSYLEKAHLSVTFYSVVRVML